jgi:solute carrier family 25 carnitine/acylcarnitine transporter 20/29
MSSEQVETSSGSIVSASTVEKDKTLHGALAGSGSTFQEFLLGLAGGVAFGLVSPIVGHPFDTIKTKMQAHPSFRDSTIRHVVTKTFQTEGLRGFYKGFIPPLVGSMAYRGALFSTYSGAYAACEHIPVLHEPIPFTGGLRPSVLIGALAASIARALIESPLDFIKVRYQIGKHAMHDVITATHHGHAAAPVSALGYMQSLAKSPFQHVAHLYHGFFPTLFRTIGLVGSFFVMVDYSVRYIPDVINAPYYGPFFKGGVCATVAWVFAFPFESAKSVIQADTTGKYKNMRGATWKVMAQLYRDGGFSKGLYRGFGPGAGRSFIANGVSMCVYSWFQDAVRNDMNK